MPLPISVFLNSPKDAEAVLEMLATLLPALAPQEGSDVGPIYRCRVLDIEYTLLDGHDLENDLGIQFTQYRYQLELVPFRSGTAISGFDPMFGSIARFLAEVLSERLQCQTEVVENLQLSLGTFPASDSQSG